MSAPKDQATVPSVDSIIHHPWEFVCGWYNADDIHQALTRNESDRMPGDLPAVPADVYSREFAEWLTDQYRLAMRKGAELATREMQVRINEIFRR
jgi:hypothetical protein